MTIATQYILNLRFSKFLLTFFYLPHNIFFSVFLTSSVYDKICHTMFPDTISNLDKKKPTPFGVGRLVGELTLINHYITNFVHSNLLNTIHSVSNHIHFILQLLFLTLFSLNLIRLEQLSLNHITLKLK